MTNNPEIYAMALECEQDGRILSIIYQNCCLAKATTVGFPFVTLVSKEDMHKALTFLAALRSSGAEFNWEMAIPIEDHPVMMFFSGVLDRDRFIIVGTKANSDVEELFEEMQKINNEHIGLVRKLLKERSSRTPTAKGSDIFGDMMRLNNEFANMQRELSKKNSALKDLVQRKNTLIGIAAHDLRNPLNVIAGYAEFLEIILADRLSAKETEMLSNIRQSSSFMFQLVEDLMHYAKLDLGALNLVYSQVDINLLVERNILRNSILSQQKGIRLIFEAFERPLVVNLDTHKIDQVLNNLITNAVKFSHQNTEIRVTVTREGESVSVTVADQGQGIPDSEIPKLFQPFSRASVLPTAGESSTGLGLAICKSIIEGHGGCVTVESTVGKGSIFTFTIPLRTDAVCEAAPAEGEAKAGSLPE